MIAVCCVHLNSLMAIHTTEATPFKYQQPCGHVKGSPSFYTLEATQE